MKAAALVATILSVTVLTCAAQSPAPVPKDADAKQYLPTRPVITKKGTIDLDLCETTPFVFHGKVYRLEWFRKGGYLRIMDRETRKEVSRFGKTHKFPCAYVEGDTVYVIGTTADKGWCGTGLTLFTSKDLIHWDERVAYQNPEFRLCNTSVCKAGDRYVMSIELAVGGYIARFLESRDLVHWTLMPPECGLGNGSPHLIRWHDGWFYLFSTVGGYPTGWVLLLQRSRDLKTWEASPFNPMMFAEEADKQIANPDLTEEQRAKIAAANNRDNSDIDFCEVDGKLLIDYCWGNQTGKEFIAEAEFAGSAAQFMTGWFPDAWTGIQLKQLPSTFLKQRSDYGRVLSAANSTVTVSSNTQGNPAQLLQGALASPFAFHTKNEANPWVTIDLGREALVTGVLVRNRTDGFQERAENLRLQVSADNQNWREVWKAEGIQPEWEIPLLGQSIKARYVRLDTHPNKPTPFHLQHVEIWGRE